jgi:ssDNA-binding Zn-finger/Zn-ribbon topoisomerase 1
MKKYISLEVECPHCLKSLMCEEHKLHGYPSIKVNITTPKERGTLHLCSLYECFDHLSDVEIKDKTIVEFTCPHCNKELQVKEECKICGAPMVSFTLKTGGRVTICSRKGCSNHYVAFEDLNSELLMFYDKFKYGIRK